MEESRSFPFGKCPFIGYSSTASRSPFPHKGRLTRRPNSPINSNPLFFKHLRQNGLRPLVDGGLAVVVNDDHENSPTVILAIAQSLWHRQRDLSIGFLSFFVPNGNLTKKALCGIMFSYGTMPRSGDAEGRVLFPRLFGIFFCVRKN